MKFKHYLILICVLAIGLITIDIYIASNKWTVYPPLSAMTEDQLNEMSQKMEASATLKSRLSFARQIMSWGILFFALLSLRKTR